MIRCKFLLHSLSRVILWASLTHSLPALEIPELEGDWWQIAEREPNVSPYHNPGVHNTCDFTLWQAADGQWQCVACIRSTTYPGATRLFHRWEGTTDITAKNWTPQGIFWTTDRSPGYTEGKLQAPHCFKHGDHWYLFHNSAGAHCLISADGKNFTQHQDYQGDVFFYGMARDTMVFNNLAVDGRWYAYFLNNGDAIHPSGAYVGVRHAQSLEGPWSDPQTVSRTSGNAESPFVVRRGNYYYQWSQMDVFVSQDPLHFDGPRLTKMTPGEGHGYFAPEVLLVDGQYYIAGYNGNGIWISRMRWVDRGTDNALLATLALSEGELVPAFDPGTTSYSATVSSSSVRVLATASNPVATITIRGGDDLLPGLNTVLVEVLAEDGVTRQTYTIELLRGEDIYPPAFLPGWPEVQSPIADGFSLAVQLGEAGVIHYVIVPDGAPAPSATEVAEGQAAGGGAPTAWGSFAVVAASAVTIHPVTGLAVATPYDVYLVAEDGRSPPNRQLSPTHLNATTFAPTGTGGGLETWSGSDKASGGPIDTGTEWTGEWTSPQLDHDGHPLVWHLFRCRGNILNGPCVFPRNPGLSEFWTEVENGVGELSFLVKAHQNGAVKLDVWIGEALWGTSGTVAANTQAAVRLPVNQAGRVKLRFLLADIGGDQRALVDDIAWTGYSGILPTPQTPVVSTRWHPQGLLFSFATESGVNYRLLRRPGWPSPVPAEWTDTGFSLAGDGTEQSFLAPVPDSGTAFYTVQGQR